MKKIKRDKSNRNQELKDIKESYVDYIIKFSQDVKKDIKSSVFKSDI